MRGEGRGPGGGARKPAPKREMLPHRSGQVAADRLKRSASSEARASECAASSSSADRQVETREQGAARICVIAAPTGRTGKESEAGSMDRRLTRWMAASFSNGERGPAINSASSWPQGRRPAVDLRGFTRDVIRQMEEDSEPSSIGSRSIIFNTGHPQSCRDPAARTMRARI